MQHQAIVKQSNPRVARHQLERIHSESFAGWFAQYVEGLQINEESSRLRDLKLLAGRPNFIGAKYKSGDTVSVVPMTATRFSLSHLNLKIKKAWFPWYSSGQVGGWSEAYYGLTFEIVKGAGHEVPSFQLRRVFFFFRVKIETHSKVQSLIS